jgi:Alpha/beta hydrolase domain
MAHPRGSWIRRIVWIVGVLVVVLASGPVATPAQAASGDVTPFTVAMPTVTGPIPSTPTSFPFIADGFSVQPAVPAGYVEEEFFVSGVARIYEYTSTGIRVVTPCPAAVTTGCERVPYTTRMLVKRPVDPRRFSGTVVVEPLNPSAGFDLAPVWDRSRRYLVDTGDVFVGWTSKSVAVNALQGWNPARYAALNWPYVPFVPGGNSGVFDGITFDIAAQVGALFKANRAGSPVRDLRVRRVFEAGFSQDGGFTFTQADVFHALERLPGGGIYDGYFPGGTGGPSNLDFGLTPAGALAPDDARRHMQPREVPVIHVNTETEVALGAAGGLRYRRPDSDSLDDRYRLWEVPGASHVDSGEGIDNIALDAQELLGAPAPSNNCVHMGVAGIVDPNTYPFRDAANAALADLTRWVTEGVPPPRTDRIQLTATTPAAVARDQFGNALGGLRTPFVDVPTATYVPTDTARPGGSVFCVLDGYNVPFGRDTLATLYRNHGQYVARVVRETNRLVREGFWLRFDAGDVVEEAVHADVP